MDPAMTEWERSREQEEFVRASILYRPSTSSLSSRFTRAKQEDEDGVEVTRDQEVRTQRQASLCTLYQVTAVNWGQLIPGLCPVARAT